MAHVNFGFDVDGDALEENLELKHTDDAATSNNEDSERAGRFSAILHLLYRRRGLLFAVAAALFFSFEDVLMDILAEELNAFQITCMASSVMSCLPGMVVVIRRPRRPRGKYQWISLAVGGLLVAVGYPTAILSLKYMDVGAAVAIIYTMPIFAGIFGWIILKEALKLIHVVFVLFSFGGVILIAQPEIIFGANNQEAEDPEKDLLLGTIYGLLSAISFAMMLVVSRKQIIMGINMFVIMLCNAAVTAIGNGLLCTILQGWTKPSVANWFAASGYALADFLANMTIIIALTIETAVLVSIASTSEVIFAFILQIIIFQVLPDWITVLGAILIIISCVGIALNSPEHAEEGNVEDRDIESEESCRDIKLTGYKSNMTAKDDTSNVVNTSDRLNEQEAKPEANGHVIHTCEVTGNSDNVTDTVNNEQSMKIGPTNDVIQTCDEKRNDNVGDVRYNNREMTNGAENGMQTREEERGSSGGENVRNNGQEMQIGVENDVLQTYEEGRDTGCSENVADAGKRDQRVTTEENSNVIKACDDEKEANDGDMIDIEVSDQKVKGEN